MRRSLSLGTALFLGLQASASLAETPRVVADIAPVQALVARVMQGVGTAELIIPADASPHGYAMRPSEARALIGAALIVTVGPALTPWLEEPIQALAPDARRLVLMEAEGMRVMPFREGASFAHDHGHEEDAHGQEDHAEREEDHDHDHAHDAHEDHAEEEHAEDAHDHGAEDPHIWLDPVNGAAALAAIAAALAEIDPANAESYRQNAAAGQAELTALVADLSARLEAARGKPFIVFHDAFHYFEARFGVEASAAVSAGDAASPGAARIAELREHVAEATPVCAFAEPQMNTAVLQTVIEGQGARLAVLDPLGSTLEQGPALYPQLLEKMAQTIADCLAE